MRLRFKLFFATLIGASLLYSSCKKSEVIGGKQTVDQSDIARKVALGLYNSLYAKFSGNQGLQVGGVTKITTMGVNPTCGEVVTTPTNFTTNSGDTTSVYAGNSVFTYQCNGSFDNTSVVDAYTLADTLKINQPGSGFANYYNNTQDYVVKAIDANYDQVSVAGSSSTTSRASKFKNGSTGTLTGFYQLSCQYTIHSIATNRTSNSADFVAGSVDFSSQEVDAVNGAPTAVVGYILFLPNHILEVNVRGTAGNNLYDINSLTGQVTTVK